MQKNQKRKTTKNCGLAEKSIVTKKCKVRNIEEVKKKNKNSNKIAILETDDISRVHMISGMIQQPNEQFTDNKDIIKDIHEFFEKDDISRHFPSILDEKRRDMTLSLKESYFLFVEDRIANAKGI